MTQFLTAYRFGSRSVLCVLLALHLGVAQAAMVPPPPGAPADDVATSAGGMETPGCHHLAMADGGTPAVPAQHHCCDAGQCHCPIFMSVAMQQPAQGLCADHWLTPLPERPAAHAQRPAPDLRPPIAV